MSNADYYNRHFNKQDYTLSSLTIEEKRRWEQLSNMLRSILETGTFARVGERIKILDFGCGDGRFYPLLSQFGEVHGVDIASEAIERARAFLQTNTLHAVSAVSPEVRTVFDFKFDVIISTEVIEHLRIEEKVKYFENVCFLLKPGGKFLLTTPNARVKYHHFSGERRSWKQPLEEWISAEKIVKLLNENQIELVSFSLFYHEWMLERYPKTWLNIFFNRYTVSLAKTLKLTSVVTWILRKLQLGLYQMVLAVKPTTND